MMETADILQQVAQVQAVLLVNLKESLALHERQVAVLTALVDREHERWSEEEGFAVRFAMFQAASCVKEREGQIKVIETTERSGQ